MMEVLQVNPLERFILLICTADMTINKCSQDACKIFRLLFDDLPDCFQIILRSKLCSQI